jgi:hypothetical protein
MELELNAMINVRIAHPSGGLIVSALVRDMTTHEVFMLSSTYYNYTQAEARKSFIVNMSENHLVLVND